MDEEVVHRTEHVVVDFYSCEEAVKRLNDYLDHELSEDERCVVMKHLEICKPCLKRFSFEEKLLVSIRTKLSAIRAPEQIRDRLRGMLRCCDRGPKE